MKIRSRSWELHCVNERRLPFRDRLAGKLLQVCALGIVVFVVAVWVMS